MSVDPDVPIPDGPAGPRRVKVDRLPAGASLTVEVDHRQPHIAWVVGSTEDKTARAVPYELPESGVLNVCWDDLWRIR